MQQPFNTRVSRYTICYKARHFSTPVVPVSFGSGDIFRPYRRVVRVYHHQQRKHQALQASLRDCRAMAQSLKDTINAVVDKQLLGARIVSQVAFDLRSVVAPSCLARYDDLYPEKNKC